LATILELARYADVSAENVIRVVNGEPVSGDISSRVREALAALGPPPYPGTALEPRPLPRAAEEARRQLLETVAETAAELESRIPEGVGDVVYEALRIEVRPVAHHIAQMGTLVEQLLRRFERLDIGVDLERRERLEDVALLTELITTGWRMVDRRLGRIERMLERQQAEDRTNGAPPVRHLRVDAPVESADEAVRPDES
jgi:uncharacterized membrane protein YccC